MKLVIAILLISASLACGQFDLSPTSPNRATPVQAAGIRTTLDLEKVQKTPTRLLSLWEKLFAGYSADYHPVIRIATMRDSTGIPFGKPYWYGKFGVGGMIARPTDDTASFVSVASGASVSGTDFTQFCAGNWWIVPTGGVVTYLANDHGTAMAEVYYFAESGGGTFKLQYDIEGLGSWLDISGASYNTNNGGARAIVKQVVSIESGFSKRYRVRAVGVSGTSNILGLGTTLKVNTGTGSRPGGVVHMDWGIGGSTHANWVSMPQAQFTQLAQAFAPDIVFIRNWENISNWSPGVETNFPTVISRLRAANPRIAIVVVGSHPTGGETLDCEDPMYEHPMDLWLRDYCQANDVEFLDVRKMFPSRSEMVSMGFMSAGDVVHLDQSKGARYLDMLIAEHMPMLRGATTIDWIRGGGSQMPRSQINGIQTVYLPGGMMTLAVPSRAIPIHLNLMAGDGNFASNWQVPQTGITRLADGLHDGRLGIQAANSLGAIIGQGRMWIGTGAASTSTGIAKQIGAGLVVQAPSTTLPTANFGAIASQTSNILTLSRNMSQSTDGDPLWSWLVGGNMEYEGTTSDAFEATIATQEPTVDATITIPTKNTGTVCVFLGTLADPPAGTISTGAIYVDNNGGDTNAAGTWLYTGSAWTQLN